MVSPKVTAATTAAAATTIISYLLTLAGIEIPAEVQGAITIILVALAGYLVPDPARIPDA
jgi:hypothetical protein